MSIEVTPQAERDRERIAAWRAAKAEMPATDEVESARQQIAEAEALLASAVAEYRRMVVRRAALLGWTVVAEEEGTSAKAIHSWRRELCPEVEDLTGVPLRELPREERRMRKAEEKVRELERAYAEAYAWRQQLKENDPERYARFMATAEPLRPEYESAEAYEQARAAWLAGTTTTEGEQQ